MSTRFNPTTIQDGTGALWRTEPFANSPRPWLSAILTLASIALVIVASLGPWLYIERGPSRAIEVIRLDGTNTDGVLSLGAGIVGAIAVLIALAWPRLWGLAWLAVAAMVFSTLIPLFDWILFDPMEFPPVPASRLIEVEWGLKLLTAAAPLAVLCAARFARDLMRGDY